MTNTLIITDQQDMAEMIAGIHQDWIDVEYDPFLDGVLDDLQTLHANYFAAEAGPDGKAWPENAPATVARKGHGIVMVDSERLKNSLVGQTADSIRETFQEGTHAGLRYGTDVEYAGFHNEETDGRPTVGLAPADVDAIAGQAVDYALGEITL